MSSSDSICIIPFKYSEVFKDRHYLCCPGWLNEDVYDTGNMLEDFNSNKANTIRNSILDGSYKYCSKTQCPHLASIEQDKNIDGRFIPKTQKSIEYVKKLTLNNINLCFDESCNYKCPSCRLDFINFKGKELQSVEDKLLQVEKELAPNLEKITLTGGGDPFFSNSFRKFLLRFEPKKFPKLKNIHILTNGSLWTETLWNKLYKIHPYVKTCEISIDAATKNTYENVVRLGGDWNKLIDNLEFITNIKTIKRFTFSFVTQDSNFREMLMFSQLFNSSKKLKDKKYSIFFNHLTNWGTFTDQEYIKKDISDINHPDHDEFLNMLKSVDKQKNVIHNFKHLIEYKKALI
jgi:organic radical activating enzyme